MNEVWRITCERSEFVTKSNEDTADFAKCEQLLNISVRREHIRYSIFSPVWEYSIIEIYTALYKHDTSSISETYIALYKGTLVSSLSM